VFESLSEKLHLVFQQLGSKGRLTEKDIEDALREIRMALLEADVNFRVARELVANIRERALAQDLLRSLTPGQQVVKITNEELTQILTTGNTSLVKGPSKPTIVLVAGLNGSGKTTTTAKLGAHIKQAGERALLIAADPHRPAAIDQLETLGTQVGIDVYSRRGAHHPADLAEEGVKRAMELSVDWAIVDTAGRFQVDDQLMAELEAIHHRVSPDETLLVLDAMTGQDAIRVAEAFNEKIGVNGLVMTKLDGDARGGAALSIAKVTSIPIKFLGTGERTDALEQFHPDRLASRILGMGDMLSLIEKAEQKFDEQQAINLDRKIRQATFDLEDFADQIRQLKSMGPLSQIMEMIPGFSSIKNKLPSKELDEGNFTRVESIIYSMTPEERRRPEIIGGSRRRRIAKGSGTTPQDVNQLLNQFRQMQRMMKQMSSGKGRDQLTRMLGR